MSRSAILVSLVLAVLASAAPAMAFRGYVQSGESGSIAWGNGMIDTNATVEVPASAPDHDRAQAIAVRGAVAHARKTMLDFILGVNIDSSMTVGKFLAGDPAAAEIVRGLVHNSRLERPGAFDEKGRVAVYASLRGELAQAVLPATIPFQSGIAPRLPGADVAAERSPAFAVGRGYETARTGIVIDARGQNVRPALVPVIYGADGIAVYGAYLVSRSSAVEKGVAAYATTDDPTVLAERVGIRPMVVKAVSAAGRNRSDVVISDSDASIVAGVLAQPGNLSRCAVVIILDAPVSPEADMASDSDAAADNATVTVPSVMEKPVEE